MIKKEESIEAFNALSDTFYDHPMYFPLFWLEEGAYLDDENADLLKDLVRLFVEDLQMLVIMLSRPI